MTMAQTPAVVLVCKYIASRLSRTSNDRKRWNNGVLRQQRASNISSGNRHSISPNQRNRSRMCRANILAAGFLGAFETESSRSVHKDVSVSALCHSSPTVDKHHSITPISPYGQHPNKRRVRPLTNFDSSMCQNA